jgi:hypothetical protein
MSKEIQPGSVDKIEEPVANRFTPDAQERASRLRAMAADFPDDEEPRALTVFELRIARSTSVGALEKAALFAEAVPGVTSEVADAAELRDAIAFELAYGGVRDEAQALARTVDRAIQRRKLKAVRITRGLYRMAKGYVTLDAGDAMRPHVDEMKRSLAPRRRKRTPAPPNPVKKQ